jgi:hypothetical protein
MEPLLADPALKPGSGRHRGLGGTVPGPAQVADSSPLFALTTAEQVQTKQSYLDGSEVPGLIVMHLDDTVGEDLDPRTSGS